MDLLTKSLTIYLLIMNAAGFLLMHLDKEKAKRNRWRISEATLLTVAALGGSIGSLLGMYLFQQKTRHLNFRLGLPDILAAQVAIAVWLITVLI